MRHRVLLRPAAALLAAASFAGTSGGCSKSDQKAAAGSGGSTESGGSSGSGGGGPVDGGASDPIFGTDGHGKGDVAQMPCDGGAPAMGTIIDMPWPNPSNVGHDGDEGSSLHFHWSGSVHNVVQVASWQDYWHPDAGYADPGFVRELTSGPKAQSGDLYLSYGTFACGYRPGIYFFVDEGDALGGIVSAGMTVPAGSTYYTPKKCSTLSDPTVYGGRYSAYASRDCSLFEINNFQTASHMDWIFDTTGTVGPKQGDLLLFRWTGFHSVVQVHDVTQDHGLQGGITSGAKKECVGGPAYSCANGPPIQGEYLVDTEDYRPGTLHFEDELGIRNPTTMKCWNSGCTGMNQQLMLAHDPPAQPVKCCDLPGASGKYSTKCQVVDVYNDGTGASWSQYLIPAGGNDVVRFRWAGSIQLFQVATGGKTPVTGGFGMSSPAECVPGPHLSCLNQTTEEAQQGFLFDVAAGLASKVYEQGPGGISWPIWAIGDPDGATSVSAGAVIYLTSPNDPNDPKCP